jgi:hypothetical protein
LSSGWDEAMLANELQDLHADEIDLGLTGFDAEELGKLLGFSPDFEPGTEEEQGRLDEKAKTICPRCQHEFTT